MLFKKLTIFFSLLIPAICSGQYIFNTLQTKNGLSANEVFCTYKDAEGFMWFGTSNGLNRYDGASFKVYNHSDKNYKNEIGENISAVVEFGKGKIFFGTSVGLCILDKQTGLFTTVPFFDEKNNIITGFRTDKLLIDPQGRLWIFAWQGAYLFRDGKALPVSQFFKDAAPLNAAICQGGACRVDIPRQGIWIGTNGGFYFINYKTGELFSKIHNPNNWKILNERPEAIAIDRKGNMWFSAINHLYSYFDFNTNSFTDNKSITTGSRDWWNLAGCHRLFIDSKDRLWISSWYYKVFVREPDGHFVGLPEAAPPQYSSPFGLYHDAYEDNEGNIWLAMINGIAKMTALNPLVNIYNLPTYQKTHEIGLLNAFVKLNNNEWMLGKEDGLYFYNESTGQSKRYAVDSNDMRSNRFFTFEKIDGTWWCGTGRGIKFFDTVTKKFTPFQHYANNKPIMHSVMLIHEDRHKKIWYAGWGDAIYRYNPVTKESIRFDTTLYGDIGPTNSISMLEAADGKLWFSYGSKGIRIYDYATGLFSNIKNRKGSTAALDKLVVNSMIQDAQQNIWLATNGRGILKIDPEGNALDSLSTVSGLSSNNVICLFMDSKGMLWASTPEGLHYLQPGTKYMSRINLDIQLPFGDTWSIGETDKKIYVSVMDKLLKFDMDKVSEKLTSTAPLISKLSVFEKDLPFSLSSPELKLKYDQNFFTIEFSSPEHNEFSSLQYAYKLQGFNKDWVYCGRRQVAAYTNVPNGSYTFMVKCTDANGRWTEQQTSFNIIISPPFWKTWWFISLMVLIALSIIYSVYRASERRSHKKEIERTIDYFANSVYGENSVNEICWDIARNCISQLQFEDCVVYLHDEDTGRMVQKAAYGPKNPKGHEIVNPIEIEIGKGIVGSVAQTGKPLLINDTTKDERYIVDDERRFSELAVPILHDGKVIGVIDSEHARKNFFTEDHLKALSTIASISANKIAEAQAEAHAKTNEIKLLEINKMLAESQLLALRAQMNPHFVFNCLNSIQECIVTQKYGEASKYLNKFSKLFRMVLNNSGKNLVTLDEEKEVLELYLELEQMRFEKSFTYGMIIDDELETDEVLVPSMLLQPYVENALWHGLMHKEGDRKLLIEFKKLDEDIFQCVIDDNGIGRKRSFELKEQQSKTKRHESKGLKISKDRIDVLKRQGYHASLNIIDKPNDEGTTIVIELSTFLKP